MSVLKKTFEPSRPRLDNNLKDRIDLLSNRLHIQNIPLSNLNNVLCSIGLECLERSLDIFANEIKSNDFVKKYLKDLIK
jgi:hypothetical protein